MKTSRKCVQGFLLIVLLAGLFALGSANLYAADSAGEITLSVEKFTIGQGYIIEPTRVSFSQGQSVGEILLNELKKNGYTADVDYSRGFYLAGILNADNGNYKVPAVITKMPDMVSVQGQGLSHPVGTEVNAADRDLYDASYMPCAGWMYSVNGTFPSLTMGEYQLKAGDVVRVQFSLYAYGGDLGEKFGTNPYLDLPDRNPLTSRLALMKKYKAICDGKGYSAAYQAAYAAAINMDVSNADFQTAVNALPSEADIQAWAAQAAAAQKKAAEDKAAAANVTRKINALGAINMKKEKEVKAARKAYNALNAEAKKLVPAKTLSKLKAAEKKIAALKEEALKKKYTPARVSLKSAKAGKKSVKLTWKKTKGAKGYQVVLSMKKSSGFKKTATIKKANTTSYTKKKLKSGKTYYFRVRAYRKAGQKTYYGAWSTVKKAKVK